MRYLSLSRNFGKEAAMYAGMEHAAGDYVAVMDADLQDPPALLPQMYAGIQEEAMTAWRPAACPAGASRRSGRFLPAGFTG